MCIYSSSTSYAEKLRIKYSDIKYCGLVIKFIFTYHFSLRAKKCMALHCFIAVCSNKSKNTIMCSISRAVRNPWEKKTLFSDTFVYYVDNTGSYITLTVGSSTEKDSNIISTKIFWSDFYLCDKNDARNLKFLIVWGMFCKCKCKCTSNQLMHQKKIGRPLSLHSFW